MKQPKSLQPSIYKACSDLYIWKLSKMGYQNTTPVLFCQAF